MIISISDLIKSITGLTYDLNLEDHFEIIGHSMPLTVCVDSPGAVVSIAETSQLLFFH
jgi:hypothetical protein